MDDAGRWEDMGLYWAWRGKGHPEGCPPQPKALAYATISYPNWKPAPLEMCLAVTVYEGGTPRSIHQGELDWHRQQGAVITLPTIDGEQLHG